MSQAKHIYLSGFVFLKSISLFSLLNISLLSYKFLLSHPTCCKGSEVKQYSKHSPIILYKNPSPTCRMFAQCHCGCNLNSSWILQSLYIILQIGTCPSCQKYAQIPFIWKGAGCTQLTGLSGPWNHSYPFFSNTAFQVIPSQWIPVLDYGPSTVLALHFSFVLSNNMPNFFRWPFLFCPDLCLTLLSLPANAASVVFNLS